MIETIIQDVQTDITARIAADEYFSDITVLDERRGDLLKEVQEKLGLLTSKSGKSGACCLVLSPVGNDVLSEVSHAWLELTLTIRVMENPTINNATAGTGKSALAIARRLMRVLKHYTPHGLTTILRPNKPFLVPVTSPLAPVAYEIAFTTRESDPTSELRVALPVIAPNGGAVPQTVTLSCPTSGADLYYTTTGVHPSVTTGTKYVNPVSITQACTLRVCGYKAGSIASNVPCALFT